MNTILAERYRIIEPLGEGGMGRVYRGEHILMKKPVAIKVLHQELGQVEDAARRFEREAQSASRLSHPSIVSVTDFGRAESGALFLVMEYVPGRLLADCIAEGPLPVERALSLMRPILRGLAHAHEAGVVHRDLKPANIMVLPRPGGGELVKILDFGIAKLSGAGEGGDEGRLALTRGGMIFGTPSYMSPEQAAGETVDARSDLYACGVILFEMLTGKKPFVADDLVRLMAMQVTATPPSFAEVAPGLRIPSSIEAVVMRALRKPRAERFANAVEFLAALDAAERMTNSLWRIRELVLFAVSRARAEILRMLGDGRRRRIALAVAAVVVVLALAGVAMREAPLAPRPVPTVLRRPLEEVNAKIAAGELKEARALLLHELSRHPKEAQVHFALGTLEFVEDNPDAGLRHYQAALELDKRLRGDPALIVNLRALLESRGHAEAALDFLVEHVGKPGAALLIDVANRDKRPVLRAKARAGCVKLGCIEEIDLVSSYAQDLQQARDCNEKRAAIVGLGNTGDERAIEILKRARRNRGGALGRFFGGGNDCVRKDINDALVKLGASG